MGAATDYSTYLRIDDLLDLQQPLTEGAHDELLFIVVHQVYELWFKLILHELDHVVRLLSNGNATGAMAPMARAVAVGELLLSQLHLLETMSPEGFMEFRDPLAPASGFQSTQFREIEALSGVADPRHLTSVERTAEQRGRLEHRATAMTLWDALVVALRDAGVVHSDDNPTSQDGTRNGNLAGDAAGQDSAEKEQAVLRGLVALYRAHGTPERAVLHRICELFIDHDEAIARWRFHHALMAAREIGRREGTGGSLGVAYLETTLDRRFFPLLWEVRSQL